MTYPGEPRRRHGPALGGHPRDQEARRDHLCGTERGLRAASEEHRTHGSGVQFNTLKNIMKMITKMITEVQFEKEICINY